MLQRQGRAGQSRATEGGEAQGAVTMTGVDRKVLWRSKWTQQRSCTVRYCTILYTVLYCIALHCLHCTVYCTVYCSETVLYCTVLYTVLYSILYCTLYCAVYCCTLYCTVYYSEWNEGRVLDGRPVPPRPSCCCCRCPTRGTVAFGMELAAREGATIPESKYQTYAAVLTLLCIPRTR